MTILFEKIYENRRKNAIWQLLVLLLCGLLFGCSQKTPGQIQTIQALKDLQELAVVEYTITKVVKANDNQTWYKFGDRKLLITCQATVKAGIDLAGITNDDVIISGKRIRIQLPPAKIISVNLPPENIQVAYEDVSMFRQSFTSAERDGLMVQAEQQINAAAASMGILEQAKTNTQLFMSNFLMQLGFEQVELRYDKSPNKQTPIN